MRLAVASLLLASCGAQAEPSSNVHLLEETPGTLTVELVLAQSSPAITLSEVRPLREDWPSFQKIRVQPGAGVVVSGTHGATQSFVPKGDWFEFVEFKNGRAQLTLPGPGLYAFNMGGNEAQDAESLVEWPDLFANEPEAWMASRSLIVHFSTEGRWEVELQPAHGALLEITLDERAQNELAESGGGLVFAQCDSIQGELTQFAVRRKGLWFAAGFGEGEWQLQLEVSEVAGAPMTRRFVGRVTVPDCGMGTCIPVTLKEVDFEE